MDKKTRIFNQSRSELINIAYGMTGDLSDARDIVQDAYLKWNGVDSDQIERPESYLKTIVSRLCIDRFRSARQQREQYIGPWLPQPLADPDGKLPDSDIELHEQLTVALLHILETLSPDQRAIYLLHDVFDYPFAEIAELVGKKSPACRKAAQRARQKIRGSDPPEAVSAQESERIVADFIEALRSRDVDKLQRLLTDEAVLYSDGGGKATAAPKPIESLNKVSRFLISIADKNEGRVAVEQTAVNNAPGFKAYIDGQLHSIWTFELKDHQIHKIFSVLNPDKLLAR